MNSATKMTISRVLLIPIFILFFYLDFIGHYFVATFIFVLSAITDILDGVLARKHNETTDFGKFLDPIADKMLAITALILLVDRGLMFAPYGAIMTSIIVAREIAIGMFRSVAATKGVVLGADKLGKIKTIFTNIAIPFMIGGGCKYEVYPAPEMTIVGTVFGHLGFTIFLIAFVLTVVSGINYILKNKHVYEKGDKK